jgi:Ca2+-binding EF-hand superfamily protein
MQVFDKDGDGVISKVELMLFFANLGEKLTEEEANEMVKLADPSGSGKVDLQKFIALQSS